jgi:hypothetical protein
LKKAQKGKPNPDCVVVDDWGACPRVDIVHFGDGFELHLRDNCGWDTIRVDYSVVHFGGFLNGFFCVCFFFLFIFSFFEAVRHVEFAADFVAHKMFEMKSVPPNSFVRIEIRGIKDEIEGKKSTVLLHKTKRVFIPNEVILFCVLWRKIISKLFLISSRPTNLARG